jgi:hypothetical protein
MLTPFVSGQTDWLMELCLKTHALICKEVICDMLCEVFICSFLLSAFIFSAQYLLSNHAVVMGLYSFGV